MHGRRFETRRDVGAEIAGWLTFCNQRRLHPSLGYVSPMRCAPAGRL
ncbi:MAG: hypothetical protein HXY24_11500 [Rubrivivax sp.]|nr:hypothetical protein [Rubrivivax sp.]